MRMKKGLVEIGARLNILRDSLPKQFVNRDCLVTKL